MSTIIQNDLRIKNAKNLVESFNSPTGNALSYVFMGRVQPWPDENAPPTPLNNIQSFNETYDNLFALKRILDGDVYYMIPRVNWVSGVVYDYYRQDYSTLNRSYTGASNLYESLYVVRNQLNNVYVCLDNNGNSSSTVEPLNTGNEPFTTSDGYQWQRVFNYTYGVYNAHSTDNFMPIQYNDVMVTVDGAISTVIIEDPGTGYTINPIGAPNNVPFYF